MYFGMAPAAAGADDRREDISAMYLRCYIPEWASFETVRLYNLKGNLL